MKVSIITVVFNSRQFIESAIKSVLSQTYSDIEYIMIDGGSADGTVEIINKYRDKIAKFISEPDKGIYDAMNKGIKLATGEIIGILNSDDFYANENVIKIVAEAMSDKNADVCWGDLVYVDKNDQNKIIRFWESSPYQEGKFRRGWMPPHPTFFVRKEIYRKYGFFNLNFKIAADYELMLRFLEKYEARSCYVPEILVKMRSGGKSNISIINAIKANLEIYQAWKLNNLNGGVLAIFLKLFSLSKIIQYFKNFKEFK